MLPKNLAVRWVMAIAVLVIAAVLLFASFRTVLVPPALTAQDEIAVYGAVLQTLSQYRPEPGPTYVLRSTDDSAAQSTHTSSPLNPRTLAPAAQSALSSAISNLVWIDSFDQIARGPSGSLEDKGVVITLGNISQAGRQAKTSASIYVNPTWGAGYEYTLDRADAGWIITNTALNWIS